MERIDPEQASISKENQTVIEFVEHLSTVRHHWRTDPKASFLIAAYMACQCTAQTCHGLDVYRPPKLEEHLCICVINVPTGPPIL